ncbi:MFS general substrate transporter [Atractiella rhizophila]|nr:MFS general substrate transporter [Atractiella rhizophila]
MSNELERKASIEKEREFEEGVDKKDLHDDQAATKVVSRITEGETTDVLPPGSVDPIYQAKAKVLNDAIQRIGMGKYQWHLFIVTGFGWFADNLYPVVTGLILPPVLSEFAGVKAPYIKLGQNIGLLVGAAFWGLGSDIWGRRISFNITLLIVGIFATAAGGSPNYTALCSFAAVWSIGVGGNLPVDSSIFLEALPASHQYLLIILSIWWAFGQLFGALVAWPLIGNLSCEFEAEVCRKEDNMGWRYFLYLNGGLMILLWIVRFFIFNLKESPKYLMGRGRDEEAVENVHRIARYNGKTSDLKVEDLKAVGVIAGLEDGEKEREVDKTILGALKRSTEHFSGEHVKAIFATKQLFWSSSLIILIWGIIGLAFPLYNAFISVFLSLRGAEAGDGSTYITYRNLVIIAVTGVPGALWGGYSSEIPYVGRKGTLAVSTILTGVFLFASTTARTSDSLLGWNCAYSFTSNVMYGVLYGLTPELFPTKDRGTGTGLAASANRIFGIMSPIIALKADLTTPVPIYVSGALFLAGGLLCFLIPYETRGKASL